MVQFAIQILMIRLSNFHSCQIHVFFKTIPYFPVSEMANTSMTVPWSEGTLEDFSDLHSAIEAGQTQKFSGADTDSCPEDDEEEDDVVEEEPSPDDHGECHCHVIHCFRLGLF